MEGIEYELDKMRGYLMKSTHYLRNKCKNGIKRTEEKTTSCTSNELEKRKEKASLGEGSNGVVGKPTTKRLSLLWAYGKHLEILR